jgi:hypothetical protein
MHLFDLSLWTMRAEAFDEGDAKPRQKSTRKLDSMLN